METRILQGARIQERIFAEVRTKINDSIQESGKGPGIVFLGFEGVPLNKYSMPLHVKVAADSGFRVASHLLPEEITFQELNNLIGKYNEDSETNAIVILQPVPGHINPILLENLIKPEKEVEGFHPQNMLGSMVPELCINPYPMCLPEALKEIFNDEGVKIRKDDEWLFVLDDGFFTNPLTQMIVRTAASKVVPKDSPVTFINKESGHLQKYLKIADFLVVVSKHPCYIQPEWLKPGVTIIDIYSNLVKEIPSKQDPSKMVPVIRGGVNTETVKGIASNILPVPGGLMTVVLAILLRNAVKAFEREQ